MITENQNLRVQIAPNGKLLTDGQGLFVKEIALAVGGEEWEEVDDVGQLEQSEDEQTEG